jgi:hypothetical protein
VTFYSLLVVGKDRLLPKQARNVTEVLAKFGHELGVNLTLEGEDTATAPYMLDEFETLPPWMNKTVPVFALPF